MGFLGRHDDDPPNYGLMAANAASNVASELREINERAEREERRNAPPPEVRQALRLKADKECRNCPDPWKDLHLATGYTFGHDMWGKCWYEGRTLDPKIILEFKGHCPNWKNHLVGEHNEAHSYTVGNVEYLARMAPRIDEYNQRLKEICGDD